MKTNATKIPSSAAPYFQEYALDELDISKDADLIIGRILEYGDSKELKWLFAAYRTAQIRRFVCEYGFRALSPRSFNFWRIILKVQSFRRPSWLSSKSPIWRF